MRSRRDFLLSSLSLAAAACSTGLAKTVAAHPIVDTHTHFYDPTRPEGIPWPGKNDKTLYRRVLPDDYKAIAKPLGVTGTVVVEASSRVEDNQWILDLAEKDLFLLGLVGNLPVGTDDFAKHLARFTKNPLFRGIRVNAGPLKTGLSQPEHLADIKRLAEVDLELDVNGGPELLPLVDKLAAKLPGLRIVINHLANVKIDGPNLNDDWLAGLKATAKHKRVFMKVSALVEGASRDGQQAPRDPGYYVPVLDAVWSAFGEDRVIYGSNWPVSERAADYATVQTIVAEYARGKGASAAEKFFAKNAQVAYQWPDRSRKTS